MIYIYFSLAILIILNVAFQIGNKKFILNYKKILVAENITYILVIIIGIYLTHKNLIYKLKINSFLDILLIYFFFVFFYQLCSILKIFCKNKIKYEKNKFDFLCEINEIQKLILFCMIYYEIINSKIITNDLFNILMTCFAFFIFSIIDLKNKNIKDEKGNILFNSIKCFYALAIYEASGSYLVMIMFIISTKLYEIYKFSNVNHFTKLWRRV